MLGVPTVGDRVAQTVAALALEPRTEAVFHDDSYGYRPRKGALDAVAKVVGKHPPDYHFWLYRSEPPGFLAAAGPLYPGGPVWRIELTTATWPSARSPRS